VERPLLAFASGGGGPIWKKLSSLYILRARALLRRRPRKEGSGRPRAAEKALAGCRKRRGLKEKDLRARAERASVRRRDRVIS